MDMTELTNKRSDLELTLNQEIQSAIDAFQTSTGIVPDDIYISLQKFYQDSQAAPVHVAVTTRVSINL